jgi:hypothetical protein
MSIKNNSYKLEKYLRLYKETNEMKYLDKVMYYLKGGVVCSNKPINCEYTGFDITLEKKCEPYEKECVKIGKTFNSMIKDTYLTKNHTYYICDIDDENITVYDIDENKSYFMNSNEQIQNILGTYCDKVYLKKLIPKSTFLNYEKKNLITYLTQNPLFKN